MLVTLSKGYTPTWRFSYFSLNHSVTIVATSLTGCFYQLFCNVIICTKSKYFYLIFLFLFYAEASYVAVFQFQSDACDDRCVRRLNTFQHR